jgi:hypothetical protein
MASLPKLSTEIKALGVQAAKSQYLIFNSGVTSHVGIGSIMDECPAPHRRGVDGVDDQSNQLQLNLGPRRP